MKKISTFSTPTVPLPQTGESLTTEHASHVFRDWLEVINITHASCVEALASGDPSSGRLPLQLQFLVKVIPFRL
jgi:hypothetical protein